jgi:tryptophan synthase alpha chain
MTALLEHLDALRGAGRKLLVPYVTGGIPDRASFGAALAAVASVADAIEIGLPYSDPLMDGPVIAAASERAIREGVGPLEALDLAGRADLGGAGVGGVMKVVMTYYNPIHRLGEKEFCARAATASFAGLIVPDLPVEESSSLRREAEAEGLAWVPLVAPTSPPERVADIAGTATGFVYAVSTLGVTGARERLSERAARVVRACREATDLPVLVGIGVSGPEQAGEAASVADGVVIGSAVVSRLVEEGPASAVAFLEAVRRALDAPT